jgi:cation:H+ antiporter
MFVFIILFLIIGILALYKGSDLVVENSSQLAAKLGVSTLVIGLTVVTLCGIMPELSIGITSSLAKANDLIIGNALGSSILKLGLIFGIAAIITPINIQDSTLKHEFPWIMLAAVLIFFLAFDLTISRGDAILLILLGIVFQVYSVRVSQREMLKDIGKQKLARRKKKAMKSPRHWMRIILGLILIICGAKLFVDSSLAIAQSLGVSELFIGIVVIAIGTSIPEFVIAITSALRHQPGLGIGNIIGSNVMNVHFVVGIAALIHPLAINPDLLIFDFPMFIFFSILAAVLFHSSHRLSRAEGGVLVAGYFLYLICSIEFWG